VSSVLAALTFARGPSCDLIPLLIWPESMDLGLELDLGIWAGFPAQYDTTRMLLYGENNTQMNKS